MERRTIGGELPVSRACFGTMTFGGQAGRAAAARMLDLCLDWGINFFDTANVYNDGESERLLGELLGPRRSRVILASKIGARMGSEPGGLSAPYIRAGIEASLRRLKTDYLDLYYLHIPDHSRGLEEPLEAMERLVREGKVRLPAQSNHASWQAAQMLWIAETRGYRPIRVSQPMYNLIARRLEDEFLPACKALGISTVVYNPLAGGLLAGKHNPAAPLAGSRFDGNQAYLDRYWSLANHEAVSRLAAAAAGAGRSLVSVSLNWLLHHTPIDCVILGASRPEQLEENLRALEDGPLPAEVLAVCDEVWKLLRGPSPKYNR